MSYSLRLAGFTVTGTRAESEAAIASVFGPDAAVFSKAVGPVGSDVVTGWLLATKTRQFSPEDTKGLADLVETGFIKPHRQRTLLYVNKSSIPLSRFPRKFIASTILAMISTLKGVGKVKSAEIYLKPEPD